MNARLDLTMKMDPAFKEAYDRGEKWALDYADCSRGIDGEASRKHPERTLKEDGFTRHNWCGACSDPDGCVSCDLDQPTGKLYEQVKGSIGKLTRQS